MMSTIISSVKPRNKRCDTSLAYGVMMFGGIGVYASVSTLFVCTYFRQDDINTGETTMFGLWTMPPESVDAAPFENCVRFPSTTRLDAYFWTARVVSILAPILAAAGMLWACMAKTGAVTRQESRVCTSVFLFTLGTVLQGMTLMVLESSLCKSSFRCTRVYGANTSISATAFLAVATFCLMATERSEYSLPDNRGDTNAGHVGSRDNNGNNGNEIASMFIGFDSSFHHRHPMEDIEELPADLEESTSSSIKEEGSQIDESPQRPKTPTMRHTSGKTRRGDFWGRLV